MRRPSHRWPIIIAANRDEMIERAWQAPGRHWPDRGDVVAGRDAVAGGSWLGINDHGLVAAILNRTGSLGPAGDKRSRGELVLDALDFADAADAARALALLDGSAWRSFNLVVADNRDAYWLKSSGDGAITIAAIPAGVSMLTAADLNDRGEVRINAALDRFRAAPAPDVDADDWFSWQTLLGDRRFAAEKGPREAMNVVTDFGYGTVSSSLIALPAMDAGDARPVWRFAPGRPDEAEFVAVELTGAIPA